MHEFVHEEWQLAHDISSPWLKFECGELDCCGPMPVELSPSSRPIAYEARWL